MVPMGRIELPTSPLPRECSTPELHGPELGAGEGNRTLVISLEGFCSTIELHPPAARDPSRRQIEFWWRGKDSNLRRLSRQIYSLLPLTAREPLRERARTISIPENPVNTSRHFFWFFVKPANTKAPLCNSGALASETMLAAGQALPLMIRNFWYSSASVSG